MLRLRFELDGGQRVIPLADGTRILGRATGCDEILSHASVSSQHLRFDIAGGEVRFRDLLSRNGTFLNGQKVTEGRLRAGDRLRVGKLDMQIEDDDDAAPAAPQVDRPGETPVDLRFASGEAPPADGPAFASADEPRPVEAAIVPTSRSVEVLRPSAAEPAAGGRPWLVPVAVAAGAILLVAVLAWPSGPSSSGGSADPIRSGGMPAYWEKVREGVDLFRMKKYAAAEKVWRETDRQMREKFADPKPNQRTAAVLADFAQPFAAAGTGRFPQADWPQLVARLHELLKYGELEKTAKTFIEDTAVVACTAEDAGQRIFREAEELLRRGDAEGATAKYDEVPADSLYRTGVAERQAVCRAKAFETIRDQASEALSRKEWAVAIRRIRKALDLKKDDPGLRDLLRRAEEGKQAEEAEAEFARLADSADPADWARALEAFQRMPGASAAKLEEARKRVDRQLYGHRLRQMYDTGDFEGLKAEKKDPRASYPEAAKWILKMEQLARTRAEAEEIKAKGEYIEYAGRLDAIRQLEPSTVHPVHVWALQEREKYNDQSLGEMEKKAAMDLVQRGRYRQARRKLAAAADRFRIDIAAEVKQIQDRGVKLLNEGNASRSAEHYEGARIAWVAARGCFLPDGDANDKRLYLAVQDKLVKFFPDLAGDEE